MSDTSNPGPQGQDPARASELSEEQAQEYLQQLRSAPAEQVITELLSSLLNTAQVKLGRRDARLMIDLSATVIEHVRSHVSAELARQVDELLSQLRRGQVQAEESAASSGQAEPNDLATTPAPSAGGERDTAGGTQASAASRLWVPGKDL